MEKLIKTFKEFKQFNKRYKMKNSNMFDHSKKKPWIILNI